MADEIDGLRREVRASLPERIAAALAGYRRFTAEEPPCDAKGFAAWHAAAKAALAHVEVLVKLVRWAETGDASEPAEADPINRMLAEARHALGQLDEDGEDDL